METYPSLNIELPVEMPPRDFPRVSSTVSEFGVSQTRVTSLLGRRRWRFDHKLLTNAQVAELETFWGLIRGAAVFNFTNPDDAGETVTVVLVTPGRISMQQLKTVWNVEGVEVQEVLPW